MLSVHAATWLPAAGESVSPAVLTDRTDLLTTGSRNSFCETRSDTDVTPMPGSSIWLLSDLIRVVTVLLLVGRKKAPSRSFCRLPPQLPNTAPCRGQKDRFVA